MDIERVYGIIEADLAGAFALEEREYIINILKRGEKYEKMWEKLRDIYLPDPKVDEGLLKRLMDGLEQKYFPKPKPKLIKLMAELDKVLKELLEESGGL